MGIDLTRVLEELRRELQYLDSAILNLERIQSKSRRRGRPAKWVSALERATRSDVKRPRRTQGRRSD
jgi:hypothetical protein